MLMRLPLQFGNLVGSYGPVRFDGVEPKLCRADEAAWLQAGWKSSEALQENNQVCEKGAHNLESSNSHTRNIRNNINHKVIIITHTTKENSIIVMIRAIHFVICIIPRTK